MRCAALTGGMAPLNGPVKSGDSSYQMSLRRVTDPCVIRGTRVYRHVVGTASFESDLIFFIHSSVDKHKSSLKFVTLILERS